MVSFLSSSDVAMLSVIRTLREVNLNLSETLAMGTFIADNILSENCCKKYKDLESFMEGFKLLVVPSLFSYFHEAVQLRNVDSCIDLFDSAKCVFDQEQHYSPNGANVPSLITRDSFVGIYVRTICTKWNSLSFSSIGHVFENYSKFCDNTTQIYQSLQFPYERKDVAEVVSISYVIAAEEAMLSNDTFSALNNIHRFFDGLDAEQATGTPDLTTSVNSYPRHVIRQQEAMLSLATMWIQNEQFSQAIIATEEGMRMAHQLGDHTSVARALLLLHHVVDRLPKREEGFSHGAPSAESVLIRCIQRCSELNLRALEAQSILLLVRLRTKGPLQNLPSRLRLSGGISSVEEEFVEYRYTSQKYSKLLNSPHHSRIPPSALWALISSSLLVESLYSPDNTVSGSNNPNSKFTIDQQKSDTCGDLLATMELIGHAGLVSADLWSRLGVYFMSELSCKRSLRQGSIFLPSALVGYLCGSLSEVRSKSQANGSIITLSHIMFFNTSNDVKQALKSQVLRRCDQAERLLQASKSLLFSCEGSLCISRMMESFLGLIKVRQNLYFADMKSEKKLKAILQLSQISVLTQSESNRRSFLYYEAVILRCFILLFFSKMLSFQSLATFEDEVVGNCVMQSESKILKAIANLFLRPENISDGFFTLHDASEQSKKDYVPLCDASLSVLSGMFDCLTNPL
jgi:hypothetical protein